MAETPFRFEREGLAISSSAPRALVLLRGRSEDRSFVATTEAALGAALPSSPRRPANAPDLAIFWLAPTAWLLRSDAIEASALLDRLRDGPMASDAFALDATDSRMRFTVGGAHARDLLAKGTGLDLHPRAMAPGEAAITRFAGLTALLHLAAGDPVFDLYIERPAAHFVSTWLERAGHAFDAASSSAVLPR